MKKRDEVPNNQPESEQPETPADATTDAKPDTTLPETTPLDPKEEARRRSKEDLARKRRNLRGSKGRF